MMMYNRHVCADGEAVFQKPLASELLKESLRRRVKKKEKKKITNIFFFTGLQDCNLQGFDLSRILCFLCVVRFLSPMCLNCYQSAAHFSNSYCRSLKFDFSSRFCKDKIIPEWEFLSFWQQALELKNVDWIQKLQQST
jgi:hypothetical protein